MNKNLRIIIILVTTLQYSSIYAQDKDGKDVLKVMLSSLKELNQVSYTYAMTITYPQGNSQKLNGEVYVDNNAKEVYNANNLQTVIYAGKWSYKADHTEKEVAIVNNVKHMNKDQKKEMEKQLFQNTTLGVFLDSVVMKYAFIKSYKKQNDTISIDLSFPASSAIKKMSIIYDNSNKKLVSYAMQTFYPSEQIKNKGTYNYIKCTGFNTSEGNLRFKLKEYFLVNKNQVVLTKYTGYKVNAQL